MAMKRWLSWICMLILGAAVMGTAVASPVQGASMEPALGQIGLVAFPYTPTGWVACDGRSMKVSENEGLFQLLDARFGGDGVKSFNIPDLRDAAPLKGMHYIICTQGLFPSEEGGVGYDYVLGQVELFPYDFVPKGWSRCDGTFLPMNKNQALYAIVGNTFGGTQSAFKLPDLQKVVPDTGLMYCMATTGIFPTDGTYGDHDGLMGSVDLFTTYHMAGELNFCNGSALDIQSNTPLFALLGVQFGGDGRSKFNLPDLRGVFPENGLSYHMNVRGFFPSRSE